MASRESFAQAATALVFTLDMTDDGDLDQAKAIACNMQGGGGVKRFAKCPGCPNAPALKSINYKDTEVPCAVCGNALPFTRFVVKDNKLVDNACKQCWK